MLVFVENGKQEKKHWSPGGGGGELSHYKKERGAYWSKVRSYNKLNPLHGTRLKLNPGHIG